MNSMEVTKVSAAVLSAGVVFMLGGFLGKTLVYGERPHESAIRIGELTPAAGTAPAAAPVAAEPIAALLASANVEAGQGHATRQCGACHSFNEGGRNGIGPNLYGVIGAQRAVVQGFAYSAALKGKPGNWTYDEMNAWLYKPAAYAPGTRMGYAGLANTQQRAEVIAYLRSLSGSPQPLPEAPAAPTAAAQPAAATQERTAATATAAAGDGLPPVGPLLASASAERGQGVSQRLCVVCHSFNEGGRNGVGPNLWNVVGGPVAQHAGYSYSAQLKGKGIDSWNYEELNRWLNSPLTYVPGTRMAFIGVRDHQQRADVIAYLRSLATEPQPLPPAN